MEADNPAYHAAPPIPIAALNEHEFRPTDATTTNPSTTNAGSSVAGDHSSSDSDGPSPKMPAVQRIMSGRGSVPFSSLDPEGTAELTRRLTEHSMRARTRTTIDGGAEGGLGFDPFDKNGKFDLARFLRHVMDQAQGADLESRQMGLVWQNLTVTGLGTGYALGDTMGSLLLKPIEAINNIKSLLHPPVKTILHNFEGCLKPGEMCLVLGRPGAGCTSFLKTIASYRDGFRDIKGTLLYQGMQHDIIDKRLRGDVVYSPEDDIHFPTLTVWQTLAFAVATRAPQARRRLDLLESTDTATREGYVKTLVEVFATILGLRHTYNTKVGNDFIRGVSGGERKRVSVAETFASRAKVALFDNSSRGLDSSTALEFVKSLRISTDIASTTTMASIYQAGEGLTQLFDKLLVINEGRQVYYGPTSEAVEYFNDMGYVPQDRQTTADFLVACTDAMGRKVRDGYEKRVPRTADEMARYWQESPQGQKNRQEVEAYLHELKSNVDNAAVKHYKEVAREEKAKGARKGSAYIITIPMQIRLAIKRRAQIIWGDIATQAVVTIASIFQALIIGSVYYMAPKNTSGFFSRGGVLFFALLYNSFTAMSEITAGYAQRPIVIRQRRFAMIHPSSDALANTLLDMPIRLVTLICFDIILYFMVGLKHTAGQFFVFFGTTLLVTFTMVAFFRMVAAATKSESLATMVGGLAVIDLALYAGFVIPRPSMVVWWKWLSYCNPVAFAFEILLTNEFRNLDVPCANFIPSGSAYANVDNQYKTCPVASAQPGQDTIIGSQYLQASYGYKWSHAGRNAGIVFAFWFFFVFVYCFASEFQQDPSASGGVMIFKRGSAPKEVAQAAQASGDVEAGDAAAADPRAEKHEQQAEDSDEAVGKLESSTSIFAWKNVNYDVMIKGNSRRLLNNVSGFVAPGKMTALMGESGAGKTTLLNVLAQRVDTGVVKGDFSVNGAPLPRSFQSATGYCQQQDVHLPTQTVREALQFSALLRQPRETPQEEKLAYVESVIELLEMSSWAEALVGDVGQGLNVEQRKRLSIAVELAAKPKLLLFLDEPTSGLDAMAAWSIVRFLRKLADAGQAILCTIHQPSGELFNQFDRLLLLQKGGKTVFFGDIGKNSQKLVDYFGQHSNKKCGEDENPAEYILDVIGAGATATSDHDWHQLFKDSHLYQDLLQELEKIGRNGAGHHATAEEEEMGNREYAEPLLVQVRHVVHRAFMHYWRDTTYIMSKLMLNIIAGLFIGSSFWDQGSKETTASLQNKIFAIFMALVLSTSLSQQLQPVFIQFRALYEVRERPSKMYSWWVAVWAALVVEIPWNLLGGTLFFIPWYFMTSFPYGSTAALVWGYYMLFQIYFQTFAAAIAAMSPNPMIASILFSTFFSFVIVFCGVVQPPPQLPYFWRVWMFPLSPFTYFVEGMLGAVLNNRPVRCATKELNTIVPPSGQTCQQYLSNFVNSLSGPDLGTGYYEDGANGTCNYCQYRVGNDYLRGIKLNASYRYRDLGIICAYIAFNIMLCFALFYFFRIFKLSNFKKNKSNKKAQSVQVESKVEQEKPSDAAVAGSKIEHGAQMTTEALNSTSASAKGPSGQGVHQQTTMGGPIPQPNLFGGAGQPAVQDTQVRV
ncbi:probable SNQ2 - ABC transporter involved in multidrug resistance [Melanopsichium pennsylvanicum]|uniref:Pleiotropic drug resistance abc transporter n=2 Tax=Melanopsichium pennsylvanicum TaxID=63383 RepID=A0A077RBQ3_9BASI|nr:pleiotropic drug resistance abc transporter [Melanopsichium pennsylvanicum 4]SNX85670.1 probable SNQ2 - ABC transporter involved in multidrug resistance [Melanopsichium pennsylvanicum]